MPKPAKPARQAQKKAAATERKPSLPWRPLASNLFEKHAKAMLTLLQAGRNS